VGSDKKQLGSDKKQGAVIGWGKQ